MSLGEGAHDDDVGVVLDEGDRGAYAGLGREVDVGLVDDDHDVVGDVGDEAGDLLVGEGGAGRVVGRADDDGDGVGRDRCAHRVKVVGGVRKELDGHGVASHGRDGDRVGLEGTPGVDDLAAGLADGGQRRDEDRRGTGAHAHLVGADAEALREGLAQGRSRQVGVAVDGLEFAGDRLKHRGAGRRRHLVGGDLDGVGRGLAGDVARQGGDGGTDAQVGHVCSPIPWTWTVQASSHCARMEEWNSLHVYWPRWPACG